MVLTLFGSSQSTIRYIKIDSSDHTSEQIKNFIHKKFNIDFDKGIRLRNNQNSFIPINEGLDQNTKKEPYYLEVYEIQNKRFTSPPEVF